VLQNEHLKRDLIIAIVFVTDKKVNQILTSQQSAVYGSLVDLISLYTMIWTSVWKYKPFIILMFLFSFECGIFYM